MHGNDSTPRLETGMRPSINTTTQKTGIMVFDGPEQNVDDNRNAKHDLGGTRKVFNYCCAKIAKSDKICGRCGIPEDLSDQMTTIGTTAVDNTAITAVDQAATNETVAQQTVDSVLLDKTAAVKAAVEKVANKATVGDASAKTSGMTTLNSFF